MGCSSSKQSASIDPNAGKIYWLLGRSCAGKTFLCDFLYTQGWQDVDGDQLTRSTDPSHQKMWEDMMKVYADYF